METATKLYGVHCDFSYSGAVLCDDKEAALNFLVEKILNEILNGQCVVVDDIDEAIKTVVKNYGSDSTDAIQMRVARDELLDYQAASSEPVFSSDLAEKLNAMD